MIHPIFFSWQSDWKPKESRNFIETALVAAVKKIAKDVEVESANREFRSDRDTKDVPGAPPIFQTILKKIEEAAIFVADLSSVATRANGGLIPNPNVLIKYGFALKALGHHRVIALMNTAFGDPATAQLPFDMAHMRRPLLFHLGEGSTVAVRRLALEDLTNSLASAVKLILESKEFIASLPAPPKSPPFPAKTPRNGQARFRSAGEPLGVAREGPFELASGQLPSSISLAEGPALWIRLYPLNGGARSLRTQDIRQKAGQLAVAPLLRTVQAIGFARGSDGGGFFPVSGGSQIYSVAYVFTTGELWLVDASHALIAPPVLELDEGAFIQTLRQFMGFLASIGIPGPYHWIAGMEGMAGRRLLNKEYPRRMYGTCLADIVEEQGTVTESDDVTDVLKIFFERLFDSCGAVRESSQAVNSHLLGKVTGVLRMFCAMSPVYIAERTSAKSGLVPVST